MVNPDQIKLFATKYQTSELNVKRDYLQHLFLSYFYQLPQTKDIYFKGGTALRIVYHSARFSEDLDFSTNKADIPGIEDILLEVLEKIEKENIPATLDEAKTTTGGYLSVIDFVLNGEQVSVRLEISFREKTDKGETVAVTSDLTGEYILTVLAQEQLIAGKMRALLERKKARDFYDLYFILRKQLPIADKKTIFPEALRALRLSRENFEELKKFLPRSHWMIIKDFKKTLEREINRFV